MITIPMKVSASNVQLKMNVGVAYNIVDAETYDGETVFTPSSVEQVIHTENKFILSNITINPIPSNYGLITYNGSVLTVS